MSDSDLPWRLAGGKIALPNGQLWLRTAVGGALWMAVPLYVARWLGRHGRRRALHALLRWWARGVARWFALR
ncbi:MAG TPA: hypothetical protein VGW38_26030, partial [Chloroflexota bacterium]|nr:hypothetical protein [Chloroflexota bacterium]